jgi:hypothetical protein
MVKHIAPVGVVSLVLLAVCGAVCQDARTSEFLPDAPSAQGAARVPSFNGFEAHLPLKVGAPDASAWPMRQGGLIFSDRSAAHQKNPDDIFRKYLNPSSVRQALSDRSAGGVSLMGRAAFAASRTVVTRDGSGKGRLNTSYLLRTLTSVAKDAASTPYWRRSLSVAGPFSDFGSTVGKDAGMNLWHEFGPGVGRLAKSHTPEFISKIEERIGRR